jgi:hypothetical protein
MSSAPIQVFLSCSFDPKDKDVVEFFSSICDGLDIKHVNVNKGSVLTPPEEALKLIGDSSALIAVATRRDKIKTGVYSMPKTVENEISIAFGSNKQILIFIEDGVEVAPGFTGKYSTYHRFDRVSLFSPENLGRIIASIHAMIEPTPTGPKNVIVESAKWLIELIDNYGSFTWRYSVTRRLSFTARFTEPIKHGIWPNPNMPLKPIGLTPDSLRTSYRIEEYGSRRFTIKPTEYIRGSNDIDVGLEFDPIPDEKDVIEYSMIIESPYLNAVFLEDLEDHRPQVIINGIEYLCRVGNTPNIRTQNLKIQCRFPATLGLKTQNFVPFAGSYIRNVEYLDEIEMKRMVVSRESFGGNVVIEIEVKSPLTQNYYGIAWNPPKKP